MKVNTFHERLMPHIFPLKRAHPQVNEFYKKGCQEKSSASTGVEIGFSRSTPRSTGFAAGFAFGLSLVSLLQVAMPSS